VDKSGHNHACSSAATAHLTIEYQLGVRIDFRKPLHLFTKMYQARMFKQYIK
jgi:hypothetical protein